MKKILVSILVAVSALTLISVSPVFADASAEVCKGIQNIPGLGQNCGSADAKGVLEGIVQPIVNLLLFVIGAVAVVMLIIGGFRFVVSGGDSEAVKGARNTILYAIIGIAVAFLSYVVVNFVIGQFTSGTNYSNYTPAQCDAISNTTQRSVCHTQRSGAQ